MIERVKRSAVVLGPEGRPQAGQETEQLEEPKRGGEVIDGSADKDPMPVAAGRVLDTVAKSSPGLVRKGADAGAGRRMVASHKAS